MEKYIGTKTVLAKPMTRGEYNAYRGWEVPADENPNEKGFLVEYVDGGQSNHPDHEGYISWSPAEVFSNAYQRQPVLTFHSATELTEASKKKKKPKNAGDVQLVDKLDIIESIQVIRHEYSKNNYVIWGVAMLVTGSPLISTPTTYHHANPKYPLPEKEIINQVMGTLSQQLAAIYGLTKAEGK